MIKKLAVMFILSIFSVNTIANFTALDLALQTIKGASTCGEYRIHGVCLWLKTFAWFPYIDTTNYVSHYLPDAVVTVYPEVGENPWQEVNLTDTAAKAAIDPVYKSVFGFDLGAGEIRSQGHATSNIMFREANVSGHPMAGLIAPFIFFGLDTHPTQATPYRPYYSSIADSLSWRDEMLEMLEPGSWVPGFFEMGNFPLYTWGPIFPRSGTVNQVNPGKGSAVIAMRATNIATSNAWQHVSSNLDAAYCGRDCKSAGAATNASETKFQMIEPVLSETCAGLAEISDPAWTEWGGDGAAYAWNVWRQYEGCIETDGQLISRILWK